MRSFTFTLDTQTGDDEMAPGTVTITENPDGTLAFTLSNINDADNLIGDLRGLFFDVADDSLLGTLSVAGDDVTEFDQSGSVSNLGNGSNSNGVPNGPYEIGVEIGTAGAAADDIQETSFTLSSSLRDLTLDDVALESFTLRQTSVGDADGDRPGSDKLYGDSPYPVNAIDDAITLDEDQIAEGNVFENDIDEDAGDLDQDGIADGLTVTSIDGDASLVNQSMELADGVNVVINSDGSFNVDASDADYLSAGETLQQSYTYAVDDGNGGTDSATIDITVNGVNDDPAAMNDTGSVDEDAVLSGNVLDNDSDVDRLDSIGVSAVNGDEAAVGTEINLSSGALLTLNADGSYSYDQNGAFDHLNDGEQATDSFTYQIADGNGGFAEASVEIMIDGISDDTGGPVGGNNFGTFTNKKGIDQDISNVVLYLSDGDEITKVKIDGWDNGETDLDNVDLDNFIDEYFGGYDLIAASVKVGNNHNKDLGPGEGQLFLIDGDEDIDYVQGGDVPDGLSADILAAHADVTFDHSDDLFA